MKSTKFTDSEKPDLQFTLGYPSETDKLRLQSGTILQREVTERERRRLGREKKREKELTLRLNKVPSSSDAMDTDEAGKHTQNILARVNKQQEVDELTSRLVEISSSKPQENSTEDTLEDSDMDTTILDNINTSKRFSGVLRQDKGLVESKGGVDVELQRNLAQTLRHGTPPPALGISPTMTKLTFGLSKSLENMSLNPSGERMEVRSELGMGYANNEFYLPIAGCPSVSELEPQLTNQLILKGNRAKLLHVPLWHHTYYTSSYLIDDITGELYACHQGKLIAIKEQGYLQKEIAEEEYLNSQGKGRVVHLERENSAQPKKVALAETPKVPLTSTQVDKNINVGQDPEKIFQDELAEQNKRTIVKATSMLQEYHDDTHRQAIVQWNFKRRERKQLQRELLQYQVDVASGRSSTDQEVEWARMYINDEHTKKFKEELPYISRYFETIPADMEIEDNDGLSESSAGSYEAREEWTEEEYRKLMMNFNRNQVQYAVDRQVKELAIQRDPGNIAAIEKEYSRNREHLDYRQKRGHDLMKVAKSYADYTRRQTNLREKIRQEEIAKLQDQAGHLTDAQWKSIEEELQKEMLQQLECQKSHLQQKESELTEKIKRQTKMSKQLEEKCKSLKSLESK